MSYHDHNYVTTYNCLDAAVNFPAMYFSFKEIHFNSELFRTKGTRQYKNTQWNRVSKWGTLQISSNLMFDSSGKHVTTLEILKLMTCSLHVRLPKSFDIHGCTGPLKSSQSRTGKKSTYYFGLEGGDLETTQSQGERINPNDFVFLPPHPHSFLWFLKQVSNYRQRNRPKINTTQDLGPKHQGSFGGPILQRMTKLQHLRGAVGTGTISDRTSHGALGRHVLRCMSHADSVGWEIGSGGSCWITPKIPNKSTQRLCRFLIYHTMQKYGCGYNIYIYVDWLDIHWCVPLLTHDL